MQPRFALREAIYPLKEKKRNTESNQPKEKLMKIDTKSDYGKVARQRRTENKNEKALQIINYS